MLIVAKICFIVCPLSCLDENAKTWVSYNSNTFAKKELVSKGKTGFLIDKPKNWKGYEDMNEKMLKQFEEKTSLLIENKKLREKMSCEARKFAQDKFSIEKRNKKLREFYEEDLKN